MYISINTKKLEQAQLHFQLICSKLLTLKLFFKEYQFQIFISSHNFSIEILEAISLLDYWAIGNNQKMDKLFSQMDQSTIILDSDPLQKPSQIQFILSLILHLFLLLVLFLKNIVRHVWFFTKRCYNITHKTRHTNCWLHELLQERSHKKIYLNCCFLLWYVHQNSYHLR
ncbi:unnamed protein product [Paramecium pentaurelia]|uniref:Transmembrane protein n=1 Tax=Paramecium pentaurelia TaxID=43138 RepID=A0A8S1XLM4_9CILI|nr:unnamed protein product [Paramecium pentaurelia]